MTNPPTVTVADLVTAARSFGLEARNTMWHSQVDNLIRGRIHNWGGGVKLGTIEYEIPYQQWAGNPSITILPDGIVRSLRDLGVSITPGVIDFAPAIERNMFSDVHQAFHRFGWFPGETITLRQAPAFRGARSYQQFEARVQAIPLCYGSCFCFEVEDADIDLARAGVDVIDGKRYLYIHKFFGWGYSLKRDTDWRGISFADAHTVGGYWVVEGEIPAYLRGIKRKAPVFKRGI